MSESQQPLVRGKQLMTMMKDSYTHTSFIIVSLLRVHTNNHAHFALPVKVVLEKMCQLGIPIRNKSVGAICLVLSQSLDTFPQRHKRLIDVTYIEK